jgi:hypothetical protein
MRRLLSSLVVVVLMPLVPLGADEPLERRQAGAAHYKARRYFQAIECFEKALELADDADKDGVRADLARALGGLGFEYLGESENRLAEETFRRALKESEDYFASFGLGYLYFMRREDAEARTHLLASRRLRDDYAPTHKLLALLTYRKGETKRALERMKQAVRLDSKDPESKHLVERWTVEIDILDEFKVVKTKSFEIRVDPKLPVAVRSRVEAELEKAYRRIGDRLGVWPREPTAVVLYSEGRFHEATGTEHWVGGLYDGQLKLPVESDLLENPKKLASFIYVLRHEYTHVLVRTLAAECPVWFNEGLAQYLEGKEQRTAVYAALHKRIDRRIPLRKMPARLEAVDDVDLARHIYLEGLGFVEFLAERYKPFRLRLFLRALAEEHSASRAFERTYGASLDDLEAQWWSAIEKSVQGAR